MRTRAIPALLFATLAGAAPSGETAARIAAAFAELGMAPDQAECYGATVTEGLGPDEAAEAARIVEEAEDSDAVREGVKAGGVEMVTVFLAAETACGS